MYLFNQKSAAKILETFLDMVQDAEKQYEIAHAEVNSLTTKPWTRADIEGKTLSFTVNGAS